MRCNVLPQYRTCCLLPGVKMMYWSSWTLCWKENWSGYELQLGTAPSYTVSTGQPAVLEPKEGIID